MGKKKNKELEATPGDDGGSSHSDVFRSIFGGDAEQNAAVSSLFSDSNPFKRKERAQEPSVGTTEEISVAETPLASKKVKKEKAQVVDLNAETNSVDFEIEGAVNKAEMEGGSKKIQEKIESPGSENRRRKKRKRDEVEREYDMSIYGEALAAAAEEEEGGKRENVVVGKKRKKKADEDEAEDLVPKEGFDDENKLLRTVFVGNLPLKVKKKALLKEFSKFGEVESVRIRSIPLSETKKPRKGAIMQKQFSDKIDTVHAYIVYKTEQSAEASLAHNMAVVAGNHIRVDRACPPRKKLKGEDTPLYDNKRTVFVGNLPFDVKDEELYQLFYSINNLESSIEAVRVIRDPHLGLGKGIAYVLFKTREAAQMVVKKRSLKLRDRELRLSHARSDSTPSKRKNPSTAGTPNKKFASDSTTPAGADKRSGSKVSLTYQGLRATKSGVEKKVHSKGSGVLRMKLKTQKGEKSKDRLTKRPSVAARKARAKALNAGDSKQAGVKRKMESRTPESFNQKKKVRKFK